MAVISIEELQTLCHKAFENKGVRAEDARVATDHFIENEMSGKSSHGMVRVVQMVRYLEKTSTSTTEPEIITDTGSMVVFDGKKQIGPVACYTAMQEGIKRAKEHGLALVGVHDYVASSGSMAYYLRRIASAGLVCLMGCNSVSLVAPPAGRERVIGTNPVGIAIPGKNGDALIADLATSAIAFGKIMVMKDQGKPVPEGVLIDKNGNPSTDPDDTYNGAILPLADYKGFALGLMVELLSGPLLGGKANKKNDWDDDGMFMIIIDPVKMGNTAVYQEFSDSFDYIKNSPPRPGFETIPLPGERSASILNETKKRGTIDVTDKTLADLKELAA